MTDQPPKITVDDDWKAEAQREKQRLAAQEAAVAARAEPLPDPTFAELVNLVALQALVGLGLVGGPAGERIAPQPDVARHFIDMLQVLQEKTANNLSPEEKRLLDATLYDLRMRYVELTGSMTSSPGP
jgi:hypothetical protein